MGNMNDLSTDEVNLLGVLIKLQRYHEWSILANISTFHRTDFMVLSQTITSQYASSYAFDIREYHCTTLRQNHNETGLF